MSLERVDKVKAERGFRIWDLAVYGVIAALIVLFFCLFVFWADKSQLTGVKISCTQSFDTKTVFTYDFRKDEYRLLDGEHIAVTENNSRTLTLTYYADGEKTQYNRIVIDKEGRSVWVESANCPNQQCVHFGKMTNSNQFISCSPHGYMVIEPQNYEVSGSQIN